MKLTFKLHRVLSKSCLIIPKHKKDSLKVKRELQLDVTFACFKQLIKLVKMETRCEYLVCQKVWNKIRGIFSYYWKFSSFFRTRKKNIYSILNFNVHATVDLFRHVHKGRYQRHFMKEIFRMSVFCYLDLYFKRTNSIFASEKKAKINKSFVLNIKIVTVICLHSRRQKSIPTHVLIHAHLQIIVSCVCSLRTITALHNFPSLITLGSKSQLCRPFTQTLSPAYDMFSFASPVSWEY